MTSALSEIGRMQSQKDVLTINVEKQNELKKKEEKCAYKIDFQL